MEHQLEVLKGIYLGSRGEDFKMLITSILKKGNLKQKHIDILTSEESMKLYASAFTSELVDENNNYQVQEQLGDLSGNKFIVWYIYRRFPQLKCAEGVKVAARLRINYGAKNSFCQIAEELGMWDFISATNDLRQRKKKSLLEDVFEAFLGVTETILDEKIVYGVGYACVYKILEAIFDEIDISLKYEDLYDAKTRLKELFDAKAETLGPLLYEEEKQDLITTSTVFRLEGATFQTRPDGTVNTNKPCGKYKKVAIGHGAAALKADAQQCAAKDALKNLAEKGIFKRPPAVYAKFSNPDKEKKVTTKSDVLRMCENDEKKIGEQFFTRGKSKYQSKYTSTVLGHYCRKRDKEGISIALEMGANPNEQDSEGLTCTDLLLIGSFKPNLVKKVMKKFGEVLGKKKIQIHKNVAETYYTDYHQFEVELLE